MEAKLTRTATIDMLKGKLGHSVETDILLDQLWDMWEVIDVLVETFGIDHAQAIINAPSFIPYSIREVILI